MRAFRFKPALLLIVLVLGACVRFAEIPVAVLPSEQPFYRPVRLTLANGRQRELDQALYVGGEFRGVEYGRAVSIPATTVVSVEEGRISKVRTLLAVGFGAFVVLGFASFEQRTLVMGFTP